MKIKSIYKKKKGIYCIVNTINNKCYVGSSFNINQRLMKHRSLLRKNKHENPKLQAGYNKYKEENFEIRILKICNQNCSTEELISYEKSYIDELNPFYNIIMNPQCIKIHETTKIKLRKTLTEKFQKGILKPYIRRRIYQYDFNKNLLNVFDSQEQARKHVGCSKSTLMTALQGNSRICYNYIWLFEGENIDDYTLLYGNRNYNINIFDTLDNINYTFKSFQHASSYFNVNSVAFSQAYRRGNLYKNRFEITKVTNALDKFCEFGKYPEVDNTEPSLISNNFEGVTTTERIPPSNVEDSNFSTSAEIQYKDIVYDIV